MIGGRRALLKASMRVCPKFISIEARFGRIAPVGRTVRTGGIAGVQGAPGKAWCPPTCGVQGRDPKRVQYVDTGQADWFLSLNRSAMPLSPDRPCPLACANGRESGARRSDGAARRADRLGAAATQVHARRARADAGPRRAPWASAAGLSRRACRGDQGEGLGFGADRSGAGARRPQGWPLRFAPCRDGDRAGDASGPRG